MTAKRVVMRTLRTSVPPETFITLEREALEHGVTLAAWVRDVLIKHAVETTPSSTGKVDEVTWERLSVWLNSLGITGPMLKAKGCKTKADALAWARTQGFS